MGRDAHPSARPSARQSFRYRFKFYFSVYGFHLISLKLGSMISRIGPHSRSGRIFRFRPGKRCGRAPLSPTLKFFSSLGICSIDLELGKVILDVSPNNRSAPNFAQWALWAHTCFYIPKSFSSFRTGLEIVAMISNISPRNRSVPDFLFHPRGAVGTRLPLKFEILLVPRYVFDWSETRYDDTRRQSALLRCDTRCLLCPNDIFQISWSM